MVIVQQGPVLAMFPSVTHMVLGERNKYMEKSDREESRENGGFEKRENNNKQWKGDKLRNKGCIHEGG